MSINYTKDNTFIFSFVRMNPPTPGHLELIKTMIDKALELGIHKVYVITSSSMDGKNPLACSSETIPKPKNKNKKDELIINNATQSENVYKSYILKQMIDSYKQQLAAEWGGLTEGEELIKNFQVVVLCSTGTPFGFIYNTIKNDYLDKGISKINMFFIVGRDRADFLDTIVDNFKNKDYVNSIDGIILEREGMESLKNTGIGQRSISDINPSEYSASFIRNLVYQNKKNDFDEVYKQYITPEDSDKLFNTIKIGIQMKSPYSKPEEENPRSEYFDGESLPIINTNEKLPSKSQSGIIGGSKKRRKKSKIKTRNKRKTRKNKRKYPTKT